MYIICIYYTCHPYCEWSDNPNCQGNVPPFPSDVSWKPVACALPSTGVSDVDRDHFGAETGIKAQWFLRHPLNRATGGQAPTGHWSVLSQKC
jgi:hypothetical protein